MPQRELEDAALEAGAASDRKAAADLVAALHASGFILRYRGTASSGRTRSQTWF